MIKLVVIDFDGTLLDDKKNISPENIEAVKMLGEKNITCVIATGRPFTGVVIDYHKQLGLTSPNQLYIGYNGSRIQNVTTNKILFEKMLSLEDIQSLFAYANKYSYTSYAYLDKTIYYNNANEYVLKEKEYNGNLDLKPIDLKHLPDSFKAYKFMISESPLIIDEIEKTLPNVLKENYTILRSMPHYLEFLPKNCNKYTCIKIIADYLNIKNDEIMTIGDSMNDYEMIKNIPNSVAMGNSVEDIKKVAKYITCDNNHSGVAKIIHKLIK